MNARALLAVLGWLLLTASVAVLLRSIFLESTVRSALEGAVPAGVLLGLAGHLFTQSKTLTDAEEKRSLFNLQGFRQAFERAYALLADGNNQRASWIEAARTLSHGQALAMSVSMDEHKRVLELERLKFRGLFNQILGEKSAAFFYGTQVAEGDSLDDAARASTEEMEINGRIHASTLHQLDEGSIRAIWLACSWPEKYNDPLSGRFEKSELVPVMMLFPELHKFLEHKNRWHSAAGKLYPREQNEP